MLTGLGDVLSAVNRTAAIAGRGDEDGGDGVTAGLLASHASWWSFMGSGRSSGVWRGSEGVAVAAANGIGGDELRSGREGERAEERMRRGRE